MATKTKRIVKKVINTKKGVKGLNARLGLLEQRFEALLGELSESFDQVNSNLEAFANSFDASDIKSLAAIKTISFFAFEIEMLRALTGMTGFGPDRNITPLHTTDPDTKDITIRETEYIEEIKQRALDKANEALKISFEIIKKEREQMAKEKAAAEEKQAAEQALAEAETKTAEPSQVHEEFVPEGTQIFGG